MTQDERREYLIEYLLREEIRFRKLGSRGVPQTRECRPSRRKSIAWKKKREQKNLLLRGWTAPSGL